MVSQVLQFTVILMTYDMTSFNRSLKNVLTKLLSLIIIIIIIYILLGFAPVAPGIMLLPAAY